eukprot:m.1053763 g.1053763  ORF g.1053763 m.1053763 type:complete len:86 (-) comp24188_c0_seq1:442-699(-)
MLMQQFAKSPPARIKAGTKCRVSGVAAPILNRIRVPGGCNGSSATNLAFLSSDHLALYQTFSVQLKFIYGLYELQPPWLFRIIVI